MTPLFVRFIRARLRMEWLPAGRGYGWLREWALSGVIVCQLVVDIAAPVLRTRCCGGLFRPRRDPGRRQEKSLTKETRLENKGDAIRERPPGCKIFLAAIWHNLSPPLAPPSP